MAYQEKIEEFRNWALSLGCPPSAIPCDEALIKVFKSPQSQVINKMMTRVQPREVVQEVRENLLISKMARLKGKIIPACERSFLPQELQTYLKMKELQEKKEQSEQKLADSKREFEELAASIKIKNMQLIGAKHKKNQLEAKCNILELKNDALDKRIEEELKKGEQLRAAMPVKLTPQNSSEIKATKAVDEAIQELEQFYEVSNEESSTDSTIAEAKQHLWTRMREIFSDTPNLLVFNAIMKMKEEQVQHVIKLTKENNVTEAPSTGSISQTKPPLDKFEMKLLKTKALLLGLVAKFVKTKEDGIEAENCFTERYCAFVSALQEKVNSVNNITNTDESEEIISDFIVQYNLYNFNCARNEYLTKQLEELRQKIEINSKKLEKHEILIGTTKQVYSDINTSINEIHHDMQQMSQIKAKILYSKNMFTNILNNMKIESHDLTAKTLLLNSKAKSHNMSMMGLDSFNLGNESVLSSTKLEADGNASFMNSTSQARVDWTLVSNSMAPAAMLSGLAAPSSTVPCHLLELNTFAEILLDKFCCVPPSCAVLISPNPMIVNSQEFTSTIQHAPGLLLTPYGALQEVRKRILWASAIDAHSSNVDLKLNPIIVDPQDLKLTAKRQDESIVEFVDNMTAIGFKTQNMLQECERILNFTVDNPMRLFVPPKITLNNSSYADYESEFNLYYRIATTGGSIK